jgi:O-antigen ligase
LKLKPWLLFTFSGLLLSLMVGLLSIPSSQHGTIGTGVPLHTLPAELITMAVAFMIGSTYVLRGNSNPVLLADLLLALSLIHTSVCLIAVLNLYPTLFPIIDSAYYKDGNAVSRPEITTDQTRQVIYLFVCLCVMFTRRSTFRLALAALTSLGIAIVLAKVQSRWGSIIFLLAIVIALLMGLYYGKTSKTTAIFGLLILLIIGIWKSELIASTFSDLTWRFQQIDSNYGGRSSSILYLFEKLFDPAFWIPRGYSEFYNLYGAAPHSFPTMIYLNAGLFGLLCYAALTLVPLFQLLGLVLARKATAFERIGFFCGSIVFLLLMTQPVITHEIFWLYAGLVAGILSKRATHN